MLEYAHSIADGHQRSAGALEELRDLHEKENERNERLVQSLEAVLGEIQADVADPGFDD